MLADTPGGIDSAELRAAWANVAGGGGFAVPELGRHPALAPDFFERHPERAVLYQQLGAFGEPRLADVLPSLAPLPIVVSVARTVPRNRIRAAMAAMGFRETRDFVCAA